MNTRLLPEAVAELREAVEWYDDRRDGLGDDFHDAVSSTLKQIATAPDQSPRYEGCKHNRDYRRAVIARFPYVIVYTAHESGIIIVSISHSSRRPGHWRKR
ncbi:MAG: hypothetical protein DCC67_13975 [Planctomycetota bacterium]|nr:MAG: hypothetical protein DCC67_13975 [Planctomycetota bacterium]